VIVLSVVFGRMLGLDSKIPSDVPYPVFVFAGLLPWNLFTTSMTIAGNSLIGASNLLTKIYFPRIIIPLASMGGSLLDFTIGLVVIAALMLWYGVTPGLGIVLLPILLILLAMAAMAIGIGVAAIAVRYRDIKQILPFVVKIGFYLTPVIFPVTIFSDEYRWVSYLNPLTGLISAFRYCLLDIPFAWESLAVSVAIIFGTFMASLLFFRRTEASIADLI
jgi:lipopolysaccharide transport system permease protein